MSRKRLIHESALIDESALLGPGTRVWHFCHVMAGARIGADSMLGQGCFVGRDVSIGDRVRIQNNVSVFEGVAIEDDVFVGPSAVFTNVNRPRAFVKRSAYEKTLVRRGASIGANATILPGITLGSYCLVGAGAVVRNDVPDFALVAGVPARRIGWVSRQGEPLEFERGVARCPVSGEQYRLLRNVVSWLPVSSRAGVRRRSASASKPAAKRLR
jgi:UDP-2-acetamido-3-amino-2,3-dideoxy-glucuronate N-acetyltransferase